MAIENVLTKATVAPASGTSGKGIYVLTPRAAMT